MLEEDIKRYSIKWIKGYPYIYIWVYKSSESVSLRRETAMKNIEKYRTPREAWQKASSYYEWHSVGRAEVIIDLLNDGKIDLYIEEKVAHVIKRLRKKHHEEDLKEEIEKVIELWQQASKLIKDNQWKIKNEINSIK